MSDHKLTQSKLWVGFIFCLLEFISLGFFLILGLVRIIEYFLGIFLLNHFSLWP